jgi:hypothetical protein
MDENLAASAKVYVATMLFWVVVVVASVAFAGFLIWHFNSLWGLGGLALLGLLRLASAKFNYGK